MKKQRTILLVILLMLTFLTGNAGISNTFLCFGEDGHVEIETGPCNEKENVIAGFSEKQAGILSDGCGPCRDFPLFMESTGYFGKFKFSAYGPENTSEHKSVPYYPVLAEKQEKNYFSEQDLTPVSFQLAYINTDTTVLLN